MKLFIGLMSGTSMDGIDAALVDVESHQLIAGLVRPYSKEARQSLDEVLNNSTLKVGALNQLNTLIGKEFAAAAQDIMNKANIPKQDILAIGSHGQTIAHNPNAEIPYTIQVGCGHTIAEITKLPVVADFRTRDVVVGGQGAPFAPAYHHALFKRFGYPLAVINIGGIANVSYLTSGEGASGYDIGPGNCLMDLWIQKHKGEAFDANGDWAAQGIVDEILLARLMSEPYFSLPNPKSIGKEYFSLSWLEKYLEQGMSAQDVQATLLHLTAQLIIKDLRHSGLKPVKVFICGGGAHNSELLRVLQHELSSLSIANTADVGIDPDYIEAMMFAWFAEKAVAGQALDLSHITGAKKPAILGAIYPAG